ncbi:MAG TPA: L-threonylcarbamoyladenylate synthase [Candidatus Binatia bacterium]|nr:L-threonylcarbamoyladenylate synthase [Candidatus Binatia bacterium]
MQTNQATDLTAALTALKRGEVIVFPTETLYGLGADALNFTAVEKVFQLKGRDADNPFPVLVADRTMLNSLVAEITPLAELLITRFWPGPLTLVLPARPDIPQPLVNRQGGIGVRLSSQPIATELVRLLRRPLTATSANLSGQPGAHTVAEAKIYFAENISVYLDGGELQSSTGSTVAAIDKNKLNIIRAGDISRQALEDAVGKGVIET